MNYRELEAQQLIEKVDANLARAIEILRKSRKDLFTARSNLSIDEEWSYTIAYHAMLRAGRALMLSEGYRPKGRDQHKTVVIFTGQVLGEKFRRLTTNFDRMRRKRHDFIYEPEKPIARQEAEQAIADAQRLLDSIVAYLRRKNPQQEFEW